MARMLAALQERRLERYDFVGLVLDGNVSLETRLLGRNEAHDRIAG